MTDRKNFNLDFRPETYWDCPETLVANIKGDIRKRFVVRTLQNGEAESVPAQAFADSVTQDDKESLAESGRAFIGGEELPDYGNGEVEIARVCINPSIHRVISIRASRDGGVIHYDIVDELDSQFKLKPRTSEQPLSLRELVQLIDTARCSGLGNRAGLVTAAIDLALDQSRTDLESVAGLLDVTSDFYSDLNAWYRLAIDKYAARQVELTLARRKQQRNDRFRQDPDKLWRNHYPLHYAAADNDVELVRELIELGADVNVRAEGSPDEPTRVTPLHVATFWGSVELVQLLLDNAADLHAKDAIGATALHKLSGNGVAAAELLLQHGADPAIANIDGSTPLLKAAGIGDPAWVQRLIDAGADVNARCVTGETPLHSAATGEVVRVLLDSGADPNVQDRNGLSPLHKAAAGREQIFYTFGVDPDAKPPQFLAADLLPARTADNDADRVRLLIAGGADVNATEITGSSPLHYASSLQVAQALVAGGADVSLANDDGCHPIHAATDHDRADVVSLLLDHGVDVNARAADGKTPLHWTVPRRNTSAAQVLLDRGADPGIEDADGYTSAGRARQQRAAKPFVHLLEPAVTASKTTRTTTGSQNGKPASREAEGQTPIRWATPEEIKRFFGDGESIITFGPKKRRQRSPKGSTAKPANPLPQDTDNSATKGKEP
ncbi:MAG: ankyrin repeat domain-containing protein [Phycisphaeraceae bacterium]|nr:ankyrin repeat domain-containing protein [Phycisphaeraceae bacterium]